MSHKTKRSAIVTGASQGIGKAIALALIETGVDTILAGRSLDKLKSVLAEHSSYADSSTCMTLDLANPSDIEQFAVDVREKLQQLDILIHCGGIYSRGTMQESSTDQLDELYATNVRGPYALTQSMLPLLIRAQGNIVFINSTIIFSEAGDVGQFACTQHALRGIANSLRAEVNDHGIRVMSIFPGRTATPRQKSIHEIEMKTYLPSQLLQPSDVATTVIECINLPETAEVTELHIRPRHKTP